MNNIPFSVEALLAKYKSEATKAGGVYVHFFLRRGVSGRRAAAKLWEKLPICWQRPWNARISEMFVGAGNFADGRQ